MRENKHTALVIKSFLPGSSRVILFDKYDGKCNAFTSKKFIPHGSLIQYRIKRMHRDVRSITCEVELMPIYESEKSQLFFHHMLELCHYFVPFEYQDTVLFDFLYEICVHYRDANGVVTEDDTRLILFKLCILLGIYPEYVLDTKASPAIYDWIYSCIMQHPKGAEFKTIGFLTKW